MLEFINVNLYINEQELFSNLNFKINPNEIHVFMGKNGVGKSSIANAIMGNKAYKITGDILYNGKNINNLSIYERAKEGIYLINQSPIAIEGVTNAEMLRVALAEKNQERVDIFKFNKELEEICQKLDLDKSFIHREINVGCSGGERKKIELLHMWMLKPSLIILDEIDSGLDVDAIKIVANSIKEYHEKYHPSIIIITHSNTLINTFSNYYVHLFDDKKLIKSGDKTLAKEILEKGFKDYQDMANVISEN